MIGNIMAFSSVVDENAEPLTSSESELEEGEISINEEDEITVLSEIGCVSSTRQNIATIYKNSVRDSQQRDAQVLPKTVDRREERKPSSPYFRRRPSPTYRKCRSPLRQNRRQFRRSSSYTSSRSVSRSRSRSRARKRVRLLSRSISQSRSRSRNRKRTVFSPVGHGDRERITGRVELRDFPETSLGKELWKKSLSSVSVIRSNESSGESEDEELALRLAALRSVKMKDDTEVETKPSIGTPVPELVSAIAKHEIEEEEDEELLRARLLIEVARRQTTLNIIESKEKPSPVKEEPRNSKPLQEIPIPKTAPLVINLQQDSDSSEDEIEASINQFLKSARENVEQSGSNTQLQALSHLPKHQQEEYHRLKQEIVRRETILQKKENKPNSVAAQPEVEPVAQVKVATALRKAKPAGSTPKPNPFKNLLLQKKRGLEIVKTTLTKQLKLVAESRQEWDKDKKEVSRLKQLLQQAEEKEQQSRSGFDAVQKELFRLRNELKATEDEIAQLEKKLKTPKLKKMLPIQKLKLNPVVPVTTPLRVKPQIVAKALKKNTSLKIPPSKTSVSKGPASSIAIDFQQQKRRPSKASYEEKWLFGNLGEDWEFEPVLMGPHIQSYKSLLTALYAPPERRIDPSVVVCRYDLDNSCRDVNCKFQHLPRSAARLESAPLLLLQL